MVTFTVSDTETDTPFTASLSGTDAAKLNPKERTKIRNKTFPGIAKAMAEQWG